MENLSCLLKISNQSSLFYLTFINIAKTMALTNSTLNVYNLIYDHVYTKIFEFITEIFCSF